MLSSPRWRLLAFYLSESAARDVAQYGANCNERLAGVSHGLLLPAPKCDQGARQTTKRRFSLASRSFSTVTNPQRSAEAVPS